MAKKRRCPLGNTCDRCLWYIEMIVETGTDRNVETKHRCVLEATMDSCLRAEHELKGIHKAVNSNRNHVTKNIIEENKKTIEAIENTKVMFGKGILGLIEKLNEFKQIEEVEDGNLIDEHATRSTFT